MTVLRAGLYERVSTEEQALHGYSISTQKDNLEEFCQKMGYKVVNHYTDEGISGAKPPLKRPALRKLLDDVQAGKIDIIIFTKLDRWFRSIENYYKVQEILDKHNVPWKAILEDYNTDTADGRLKVNIMLSVAANERERTSERIKYVLDHKFKNKEAAFGGKGAPLGYIRKRDENGIWRLVKDPETEQMMNEFWDILLRYNNLTKAARHINLTYGKTLSLRGAHAIMRKEIYTGTYRGIENFCEPYVNKKDWLDFLSKRPVKKTQNHRVYLFVGLVKCGACGWHASSNFSNNGKNEYKGYRCVKQKTGLCDDGQQLSEMKIEKYLLDNLSNFLKDKIESIEIEKAKPKKKPTVNIPALKEKLRRLNVSYMAGNLTDEEYLQEQAEIKAKISQAEQTEQSPAEQDIEPLKKLLKTDFRALYNEMTEENKQAFWRGLIKEIVVKDRKVKSVIFL